MWLILQQKKPDDFVICTGKQYTVEDFAKLAFKYAGLDYRNYLKIDQNLNRPADIQTIIGNFSKAKKILKWKHEFNFKDLVKDMVNEDLKFVEKEGY